MDKRRQVEILIGVVAIILLITLILSQVVLLFVEKVKAPHEQFGISTRPEGAKLDLTLPDPDNKAANIAFADDLYKRANEIFQNTDNVAMMVQSSTKMFGGMVIVPGYRYIVKNEDKFHYIEYSFIQETKDALSGLLSAAAGAVEPKSTKFALRKYTDKTMDKILVQRTIDPTPTFTFDEKEKKNIYNAEWDKIMKEEEEIPIYYKDQTEKYEQTEQLINSETIKDATITYNEEEGYYTLVLELDPDLSTDKTRARLIASTKNSSAKYIRLIQTIEIWDNGYYRYFRAEDDWEAPGVITMKSEIDFRTYFYYDSYWTNPNNYQYMDNLKEKMENAQ